MNMRQQKYYINNRIAVNKWFGLGRLPKPVAPFVLTFDDEMAVEAAAIEAAKEEFMCIRVKDGVVVDTFDTREEARALVDRHIRGKKARLFVESTLTSDRVLFEEAAA